MNSNDFSMNIRLTNTNLHKAAEATGFNNRLVSGKASKESYAEFIFNYLPVYKAIEEALDSLEENDRIKPFITKKLYRSELIKKDIEFLLGDKAKSLELLPSTKAYVARIKELVSINPILIVAHAYTRFLADLFGGRTIHEIVKESYSIEANGLNYFQFPEIENLMDVVFAYRDNLTNMNLTKEEQELFLNEVANSYIYNIGISTELEAKLYSEETPTGHPHGNISSNHPPMGHGGKMPVGHPHINDNGQMPKGHPHGMPMGHPHK